MDEVERDSNVTINVGFGNITFYRDADGAYAHAVVDLPVTLGPQEKRKNDIQVAMRFSCSPDTESVKDIVEKSREHLLSLLRSAVSHVETATADSLLYQVEVIDQAE